MAKINIAKIQATHSGFVNGNNTWYLEEDMANAVDTWTEPFQKPVLTHHEMKKDAIGRVTSAKYITIKNPKGKNPPQGYIQLETEITDADAIVKIKDKRYNTVSISTDARTAVCSICKRDIAKDGLCEHERGKKYDGKKCFWYLGGLKYKEVSYVNAPADEYACTESFEEKEVPMSVTDSKTPKFQFDDSVDKTTEEDCENWDHYTEDDLAMAHWLIVELDNELPEEDKKLSTKARKSMKTSTFCGPNRSFPVPDCAHVTAARRLIGKYKGPGDKSKILACVSRKAKALGCSSNSDSLTKEDCSMVITLKDALESDVVKQHIDSEIQKATQPLKDQLVGMAALTEKSTNLEKDMVTKDAELTSNKEVIKRLEDSVTALKGEMHKTLVDRVFDLRKNLQKKDVMALKDVKEVETFKAELAKRTDESLKDAVADLSKEVVPEVHTDGKPLVSTPDAIEKVPASEDAAKTAPVSKSRKETVKDIIFKD